MNTAGDPTPAPTTAEATDRRIERILFALVLVSCAYFFGGAKWNQNARLDAIFAFVEPNTPWTGTFRIDGFLPDPAHSVNTGDWTKHGEHYYANKAPGTILMGTLAYAAIYHLERVAGADVDLPRLQLLNAYALNLFVGPLWVALAAVAFFRLAGPIPSGPRAFVAAGLYLGTGLFPYATQLWGHATAAAFVTLGLLALSSPMRRGAFWAGFWLGWAACTDYLAVLAVIGLGIVVVCNRRRDVVAYVVGGLPALAALFAYQAYCFGNPFTLATTHTNPRFLVEGQALGMFATPDLARFARLWLGTYRGALVQMPVLLLAAVGLVRWFRRAPRDAWLWACLGTPVTAALVISGFVGWHGGSSVLARYLFPFLPFAFVATRELVFARRSLWWIVPPWALSISNMLAITAVNPLAPTNLPNPLYGQTYSMLARGLLSPFAFPIRLHQLHPEWSSLRHHCMWNWGQLAGLEGLWSLTPLWLVWIVAAVSVWLVLRARTRSPRAVPTQANH